MRRDVDRALTSAHGLGDQMLHPRAMGPVMLVDDLGPDLGPGVARCRGEELRMTDRSVQVDEQPTGRRRHQWGPKSLGKFGCH